MMNKEPPRHRSALIFVLKGLAPYSRENLMLSFKPNYFFSELEKTSRLNKSTLQRAYNRGVSRGLINKSKGLTAEGQRFVRPFLATKLEKGARLMIAFDIPEQNSAKRRRLRQTLRIWGFRQEQKSVWSTDLDFRVALFEIVDELDLKDCVEIFEYVRLSPSH